MIGEIKKTKIINYERHTISCTMHRFNLRIDVFCTDVKNNGSQVCLVPDLELQTIKIQIQMKKEHNLQNAETQALNTPVVMHRVTHQGAITVNNCIIYQKSNNIIAFCIDTKNKWGEITASGSNENDTPCIVFEANENTTNIKNKKTTDDLTEIEFPEYAGWTIFCCSWSKYSVYVCMVKHGT